MLQTLLIFFTFILENISSIGLSDLTNIKKRDGGKNVYAPNDYEHLKAAGKDDIKGKMTIEGKPLANLFKRSSSGGTCSFISNGAGVVPVGESGLNKGYAMHSDQACTYDSWCPYACEPGMLMAQFDSSVTSYEGYPSSMRGGIYCSKNGEIQLKNQGKGYCYNGKGTVSVNNEMSSNVAFCQTVLPGNEEMLIPTNVDSGSSQVLAVPGTEYWAKTAAHYYINPPGVSTTDGCVWGSTAHPWGNWSPYVAGANMDDSGNTFVKIGWNPVYYEDSSPYKNTKPSFGISITCSDGDCEGLPCSIDPSKNDVNEVTGPGGTESNFCVVTAKNSNKAVINVFKAGSGGNSSSSTSNAKREHHDHEKSTFTRTKTVTVTV
ncbi:uncharacterized protein HGUI_02474 [Hanseniaspora guilliermondii]|uniref:Secreted beta-glucosidase adg3 n=1 Tax=Hanseniaspora guilliermondii TaxID=56406 RepID=A0A1L0B1I7_9ASCO|nr:uncharacterized protein HGUI_02474 [Hanseniaspora guilliermondii]